MTPFRKVSNFSILEIDDLHNEILDAIIFQSFCNLLNFFWGENDNILIFVCAL